MLGLAGPSMACVASFDGLTGLESGERLRGEEVLAKTCSGLFARSAGLPGALEGLAFWCCALVGEAGDGPGGRVALIERCVVEESVTCELQTREFIVLAPAKGAVESRNRRGMRALEAA